MMSVHCVEAIFLVILSGVLVAIFLKKPRRGTVTGWYMTLYAVWRFIIEFFRADPRGSVGPLSTSQFISLFILAFGIYLLVRSRKEVNDFEPAEEPAPESEPAPVERPETAALPVDPLEQIDREEIKPETTEEKAPETAAPDEPAKEVAVPEEELVGAAEMGAVPGTDAAAAGADGGPGDGGDQ